MPSITNITKAVNEAFHELYRMCESSHDASRLLDRALAASLATERGHRRMGVRFTDGRAGYRGSALMAARYFVVRHVAEGGKGAFEHVTSYLEAAELREDVFLSYALRQLLGAQTSQLWSRRTPEQRAAFVAWCTRTRAALAPVDYARDIAVNP